VKLNDRGAGLGGEARRESLSDCRIVIAREGHIAIGIGDYAYGELGYPTNAALLGEIVRLARHVGREIATPAKRKPCWGCVEYRE